MKNAYFCNSCQCYLHNASKEEFLFHKENCSEVNINKRNIKDNENNNNLKESNDPNYSNLNLAAFTFGGKQSEKVSNLLTKNLRNDIKHQSSEVNQNFINNNNSNLFPTKEESNFQSFGMGISNRIGQHHSFLISVIQMIWNMKGLRNFIINDLEINEDSRFKFLHHLKVFSHLIIAFYKKIHSICF